jgi:sugar phosphate isomerase/epimerase
VGIAVEAEPGPINLVRDRQTLLELCRLLDQGPHADLASVVGLNLDVAHWRLAGIDLEWLRSHPDAKPIRNRIIPAHLSDHGKGHFGDCGLDSLTPLNDIKPWVWFLRGIAGTNRSRSEVPNYSGYVAMELEACSDTALGPAINCFYRIV